MSKECFVMKNEFVVKEQQSAAQFPLFYIVCLLTKSANFSEREWYTAAINLKKSFIWTGNF